MRRSYSLSLISLSATVLATTNASTSLTDIQRLEAFECRCGMPAFLTMPHANITRPSEADGCYSYKLLDARGTEEPQGVSMMFFPMVQTILQTLPGGASLPVEYPAGVSQNTESGEKFVIDIINQGLRDCPGQKYALFGYSQGATLMLKALSQLSFEAVHAVSSVILVGNPYRLPGKRSNVNGIGQPGNDATVGLFVNSALANNKTIPQLSSKFDQSGKALDICLDGDGVCAPNPACVCQLPAGHLSYGLVASVQDTAVEHVVAHLQQNSTLLSVA